jgi:DNA repair protein RecN (Recombination protein N)
VAARARSHLKVEKAGKKTVRTDVRVLSEEERREEIARMLSGATVTEEARAAAKKLLEAA